MASQEHLINVDLLCDLVSLLIYEWGVWSYAPHEVVVSSKGADLHKMVCTNRSAKKVLVFILVANSFNKCLLDSDCGPGFILRAGDTIVNKKAVWSSHCGVRDNEQIST